MQKRFLLGIALLILALVLWVCSKNDVSTSDLRVADRTCTDSEEVGTTAVHDAIAVDTCDKTISRMFSHAGIMEDANGPYMSNPRRIVVSATAAQTTAEVVASLGEPWSARIFNTTGLRYTEDAAISYAFFLPKNVKVTRLIQEGRLDAGRVGDLVASMIQDAVKTYPTLYKESLDYANSGQSLDSEEAPDNPCAKRIDMAYAAPAGLFVMVNIGYADGLHALARMVRMSKPRVCESTGYLLWAVCRNLRAFELATLNAEQRATVLRIQEIAQPAAKAEEQVMRVSTWNAPHDIYDHMLAMAEVDTGNIETVEVTPIWAKVDALVPEDGREEALRLFLEFYDSLTDDQLRAAHITPNGSLGQAVEARQTANSGGGN